LPNRLLQLFTGCVRDIAGTLLRFAAYCAVIGGAVFGAWMLVLSLFVEESPDTNPRTAGATPALWLEQNDPPPLRRMPD
jgi:hypothetical protein